MSPQGSAWHIPDSHIVQAPHAVDCMDHSTSKSLGHVWQRLDRASSKVIGLGSQPCPWSCLEGFGGQCRWLTFQRASCVSRSSMWPRLVTHAPYNVIWGWICSHDTSQ